MPGGGWVQVLLCFGSQDGNPQPGRPARPPARSVAALRRSQGGRIRIFALEPDSAGVYIIHTMQSREIIDSLMAEGRRKVAQRGSHVQFKHPTKPGRVTVPHPKRDVPIGTLRSIEKQSGLKLTR
jgi:predicted RNA binding protein YcfA (HicA-like mRNA interferase family)